jgi:hypothetical protein
MINLNVDEAYAFDYLSILFLKRERNKEAYTTWSKCNDFLKKQIGEDLYIQIINSVEYNNILEANFKTFNMVDLAKENKCTAQDVDKCNYERYKAKIAFQNTFFTTKITETKIGYEKYETK